jgi:diguanylate cyclase (GGDEF)-like protein
MTQEAQDMQRLQAAIEELSSSPARGFFSMSLAFGSGLEQAFTRNRIQTSLPLIRLALALSVVFYGSFLGYDALTQRLFAQPFIYAIVLGVAAPSVMVLLALSWIRRARDWIPAACGVVALVNALSLTLAYVLGVRHAVPVPYEILIMQFLYTFSLLGLAWRVATPIALVTLAFFVSASYFAGLDREVLVQQSYFLTASGMLGCIGCYMIEYAQRQAWARGELLRQMSEHDPMTGLYNHRVFYERGASALRQSRRDSVAIAVLLIDADHFKRYNDEQGHLAGDEALRRIAALIRAHARRPLDVPARLGGEEFALLLYNTTAPAALNVAESLRAAVRSVVLPQDRRITVSIGLAMSNGTQSLEITALVGLADEALYRAKNDGRDRVRTLTSTTAG